MASMKIAVSQLILCVALFGFTETDGKPPSAVVGGNVANDGEFPYQVSLTMFGQHVCGGSIIGSRHILTAAHCVDDRATKIRYMTVTTGTNNIGSGRGQSYPIKDITVHRDYSASHVDSWKNDIAIITLSRGIQFDSRQRAVKLPTRDVYDNEEVMASGWGVTSHPGGSIPSSLRKVSMRVIANNRCRLPGAGLSPTHLCAHSKMGSGVCMGDSGGPLVKDGTIFGVTSFVIPCGKGYPDVFTRVYNYLDWIRRVMAQS